ncbi:unnamed protein product [Mortierella alpina]
MFPQQVANMKFITIAATIFAVVVATTQAAPAFDKRSDRGSLVNVEHVPVNVEVKDVANNLAKGARILRRNGGVVDADVLVKDTKVNILSH